ncbi:mitogen-activated protein kinase [Elysia marginata]|uniref:Stress-activated protein kinase JNK n=1 Tax=Elysia marginata TaxID=1093978 RepID=A0AAV4JEC8_9GAST|nr:mitogen-activated protein kinase [Elysia marginata]
MASCFDAIPRYRHSLNTCCIAPQRLIFTRIIVVSIFLIFLPVVAAEPMHTVNLRGGISFTVPLRYGNLRRLGFESETYLGAITCAASDSQTNTNVLLTKHRKPFENSFQALTVYREFVISRLVNHKNVIRLLDAFTPQASEQEFEDVYLVTDRMSGHLGNVPVEYLDHRTLSSLIYQVLSGVYQLHAAGVYHRDLRPSFIGINTDFSLKILNFGLPRTSVEGFVSRPGEFYLHYRAPDAIIGMTFEPGKLDVWSVGCIIGELLRSIVLFPGTDHIDQLVKIFELLGTPESEYMSRVPSANARVFLDNLPRYEGNSFDEIFPDDVFPPTDPGNVNLRATTARDLLAKMLVIDPARRITVEDALRHPYLSVWYDEADVSRGPAAGSYGPEVVEVNRSPAQWKALIYEEIERGTP